MRGKRALLGVTGTFYTMIMAVVMGQYQFVKTQVVHLKRMDFIVPKLRLNKMMTPRIH